MSTDLKGKNAAITGGASGIGLATAEAMIEAGAKVVMIDRDTEAMEAIRKKHGDAAIPLEVDLLDHADCKSILDGVLSKVDHLDIFHANAGTYLGGDLAETDIDAIDRMLSLNVTAAIKSVRSVLPHMIERGTGDIIVTSSIAGQFPVPWEPVYSPSKWAMHDFVQVLRRQLIKHGVRVSSVSPGPVVSALLKDWPEENLRKAKENGSLIEPTEVSDAIMYILGRPRNVTIRDMVVLPTNFDM